MEKCLLIKYCVDGARLSPIEVCEGKEESFKDCGTYQHYMEQDLIREAVRTDNKDLADLLE